MPSPRPTGAQTGRHAHARARARARVRSAFTLLELLVVTAILAILASLLLAAAGRPAALARDAICRHHLRQWGLATRIYADDHDDHLPPEGFPNPGDRHTNRGWYIQLPPQISLPRYHDQPWRTNPSATPGNTPWLCPSNRRRSNGNGLFHYCLNQHVDATGDDERTARLTDIPAPSSTPWLFDTKNLPAVGSWNFPHTNLHAGGAHFLCLDGHVEHLPARDYWDPLRNRGHTNSTRLVWTP